MVKIVCPKHKKAFENIILSRRTPTRLMEDMEQDWLEQLITKIISHLLLLTSEKLLNEFGNSEKK